MRDALTLDQVAARFQVSKDWWFRHWRNLRKEHGFPSPMPGFKTLRWDPRAIELWQDDQLRAAGILPPAPAAAPAEPEGGVLGDANWPEILDRRAAAIAAAAAGAPE